MDAQAKKSLLQKVPYGLYICTSKDGDDTSSMLCNWVAQASFEPPMVTLSAQNDSHSYAVISKTKAFCLNLLPQGARDTASHFAQHHDQVGDKFEDREYDLSEELGLPVIPEAVGYLEMRVVGTLEGGDHNVILGEVVGAQVLNDGDLFTQSDAGFDYAG
jgi:flavin reductase (DIM6/NTAB) family NADH-FMN oxidoreductase RutF